MGGSISSVSAAVHMRRTSPLSGASQLRMAKVWHKLT